jgi:hypothetical protein
MSSAWINPHTIRRIAHAALSPGKELPGLARRHRRVLILLAASLLTVAVATAALAGMAVVSVPATVPAVIAGTVLSNTADLFGTGVGSAAMSGTELADAGRASQISCRPVPPSIGASPTPSPAPDADTDAIAALGPMRIESCGSLSRADTSVLIDPVPPKTSALIAHVWFLYRLAGMGDWESFIAAYHAAGLRSDDKSADTPLAQVQALNTAAGQRPDKMPFCGSGHSSYQAVTNLSALTINLRSHHKSAPKPNVTSGQPRRLILHQPANLSGTDTPMLVSVATCGIRGLTSGTS